MSEATTSVGQALELARMTYVEVQAALARPEPKIALLPTGSTEAHGPHLPLATDSIISEEMAKRAAQQLAARGMIAVCMPALHYAGTIPLSLRHRRGQCVGRVQDPQPDR